ncbi:gluconokinase [Dermatobacter hominis]|uniref:gluconokinase n=1 Tax=Dermatobacter hominis TaxID=2884263 RepID=UPI001D11CE6F|nr:gluconokinase, GntK/IdnK-type [Dermatobacter hominis]UDY35108.1 AAA family ATPase [Dermatobacter hominis]
MIAVVMGVAGSGKSTVGAALAARLGLPFVEGDAFHDPAALRAMSAGLPLTDEQRRPWIDRINAELRRHPGGCVCACSALNPTIRRRLGRGLEDVRWIWLRATPALLEHRLATRTGHPVGVSLLPSQLAALEPPADALAVDASDTPSEIVASVERWLAQR